jgi:hypothetical protein
MQKFIFVGDRGMTESDALKFGDTVEFDPDFGRNQALGGFPIVPAELLTGDVTRESALHALHAYRQSVTAQPETISAAEPLQENA